MKHLSASSIAAFKACPTRYRLGYVEGIREAVEPQPFRMGTAYHAGLEVLGMSEGTVVSDHGFPLPASVSFDPLPAITAENRLELAIQIATAVYETVPPGADPTEWAVEREIIANAIAAYHWLYGANDDYETVATEMQFELPLVNPGTRHSTPNFMRVGKIDRIVRRKSTRDMLVSEYKTTSKPIDSGSTYWGRLRLDTQSKFYIVAARDLQTSGKKGLPSYIPEYVPHPIWLAPLISGLLHDVFHKPQISPKMLTQADSKAFVETGEYCGQHYDVKQPIIEGGENAVTVQITVDGIAAEGEAGKKPGTFAIRETPAMFGARLLQDMTTRPEYYFARREVAFTDAELKAFEYQVWALQRNMSEMERTGFWFQNESSCEAAFRCAYCPLCYNNVACCDGKTTPPGFRRLAAIQAEQGDVSAE